MQLFILKYVKQLTLVIVFFFCCNISLNSQNKYTDLNEIKKIKSPKKQYSYYIRSSIYGNNFVYNLKDWVSYFEKQSTVNASKEDIYYINFILIHLYRISNKIDKSLELGVKTYYNYASKTKDNSMLCNLLQEIETCYYLKKNNLELIRIYKEKIKVCGKNSVSLYKIYFNMGFYDLALKDYKEMINYNTPLYKNHSLYKKAFHLNDFGVFYMYDNKIDSALHYYHKSGLLFKEASKVNFDKIKDINFMKGIVDGNIASCYLKQNKFKEAIPLFLNEIKACKTYFEGSDWLESDKVYNEIALCYIYTNQFKKAEYYINQLKNFKSKYYKTKSEYFSKLNNKDSTLFYSQLYIKLSDSIFKSELKQQKIESLGVLEMNNKLKYQEKQIDVLEKEDLEKANQLKFIVIVSLIITFFFIFLLFLYFEKNKKQRLIIKHKNEIEQAFIRNKTLLKELNHRVKNNLQMVSSVISLQASKISDQKSKKHFNTAVQRIKVLSKIHNSLYAKNQLNEINLLEYVLILKNYLVKSIINPDINVRFIIDIPSDVYLDNDKKTTIGLIINELITNSFKYAFENKKGNQIKISIYKKKDYFYFTYSDNGKGFNDLTINKNKSIGLKLILRLVNQLGEEAEINAKNGFTIVFKFLK